MNPDIYNASHGYNLIETLIMTAVAAEDSSRIVWPNSPSAGWSSGVHRLYGTPNGEPLVSFGGGHAYLAGQEWHRFYQAGVGAWNWSTVNLDPWSQVTNCIFIREVDTLSCFPSSCTLPHAGPYV